MPETRVVTYRRDFLDGMLVVYNTETAGEPYIARLSPELFETLIAAKPWFDPDGLFVAVEGGRVLGWAHACVAPGSEARHDPDARTPRIRMLVFPPDRLEVGHALVAQATTWLKGRGAGEILAMHSKAGYPFYRGIWLGAEPKCPCSLPHVHLALDVAGYRNTLESIAMTAEMSSAPDALPARIPLDIEDRPAKMAHEGMRQSWVGFDPMESIARSDGVEVGSIRWVLLPHLPKTASASCANIWGFGVDDSFRRRGIGTALVGHVLTAAFARGARSASVSTQLWNAAAQMTYAKCGFRPHRITVGRELGLETGVPASVWQNSFWPGELRRSARLS